MVDDVWKFIVIFSSIYAITYTSSWFEKLFITKNEHKPEFIFENAALNYLRKLRFFNAMLASAEATLTVNNNELFFAIAGILLISIGLSLRISAIRSLGKYWSFHVVKYPNQPLIKSGIYKYISHPGYLGSVHLTGAYLLFGSIYSSLFSLLWIFIFISFRISIEKSNNLCK